MPKICDSNESCAYYCHKTNPKKEKRRKFLCQKWKQEKP